MVPTIDWSPEARADIRRLDQRTAMRIFGHLLKFANTGRGDGQRRLRIGDYRVFFSIGRRSAHPPGQTPERGVSITHAMAWMILYHQKGGALMAQVIDKQHAHDLIEQLKPEQVPAVVTLLRSMVTSPDDDEPVTEEDIQRFREAKAAIARGDKGTPMEELLAEFGLTMADFPLDK